VNEAFDSPFLRVAAAERIAANEMAFAIYDGYPVSPGHALIIPFRVVSDWSAASAPERAALIALVDEVIALLERERHPDGFNVGFNIGEAAGQTVPHLHVHVIPRYSGDMDDPTGGVRHVIPDKANYLRG
jgi:diadenosine tetraphosphate (Ap4A) HIT family hydrolase